MTTFLDTNIVIALLDDNHVHHEWSVQQLMTRRPAIVCDIVYCEVAVGMPDRAALDTAIAKLGLERFPSKEEALFRAGKAFKKYRDENKGPKPGVLPDFLIGAVAEVEDTPLMTANEKDFTGYFDLELITPPKNVTVNMEGAAVSAATVSGVMETNFDPLP